MSDGKTCSECEHHRIEYRFRSDMEGEHPEPISICELHHMVGIGDQTGCDGTDFIPNIRRRNFG